MQKKFILKWVPKVTHINPWAFVVACVFLALVGGVLFYSVTSASSIKQKTNTIPVAPMEAEEEKPWYQNVPDAMIQKEPSISSSPSSEFDTNASHEKEAKLKAAMDSPLKAPIELTVDIKSENSGQLHSASPQYSLSQPTEK